MTTNDQRYQLDYVLLEFGGRNRGRPTESKGINTYLSEVNAFDSINLPTAEVQVYRPDYILWEKLTALHQFSTQDKDPAADRLARHWYDVDCLLEQAIADPLKSEEAMSDVVTMKQYRWSQKGVDYTLVTNGGLQLIPNGDRQASIAKDHEASISGGMFFTTPSSFDEIIKRLSKKQNDINTAFKKKKKSPPVKNAASIIRSKNKPHNYQKIAALYPLFRTHNISRAHELSTKLVNSEPKDFESIIKRYL